MRNKLISAVIPAYNEEKKIKATLTALQNLSIINEIIVVNDGSSDKTGQIAVQCGVTVVNMPCNKGKGDALNQGIKLATGDIICLLDGDLGWSAKEVGKLIDPVIYGRADMTIGSFPPIKHKGGFGLVKNLARQGIRLLTGKDISSSLSGQRVMTREVLEGLSSFDRKYGVEVGMTIDVLRKGFQIIEVPVNMTHSTTGRDLQGFIHRAGQFMNVLNVLVRRVKTR